MSDLATKKASAAFARRNPDPKQVERRNDYLARQDDWRGVCGYCKAELRGTLDELVAHRCEEYEESLEPSA